jgi:hypothetical protein
MNHSLLFKAVFADSIALITSRGVRSQKLMAVLSNE